MKIRNIEGLSETQISDLVQRGGKFVMYKYCISIVIASFNNNSSVYFVKPNESSVIPGLKYAGITAILGWWGIPWGPIHSISSFFNVFTGGKNVTDEVMAQIVLSPSRNAGTGNNSGSGLTGYNLPNQSSNLNQGSNTGSGQYNIPNQNSNSGTSSNSNSSSPYNIPK